MSKTICEKLDSELKNLMKPIEHLKMAAQVPKALL